MKDESFEWIVRAGEIEKDISSEAIEVVDELTKSFADWAIVVAENHRFTGNDRAIVVASLITAQTQLYINEVNKDSDIIKKIHNRRYHEFSRELLK